MIKMLKKTVLIFTLFVGILAAKANLTSEEYVVIRVEETAGINMQRAVTGGIPLGRSAAPKDSHFYLLDKSGKSLPLQYEVLARWDDESIKWLLVDFQANPAINTTDHFELKWSARGKNVRPSSPIKVKNGEKITLSTADVKISTVPGALLRISDRFDVKLVLSDRAGNRCEGIVNKVILEKEGDIRSTLALAGSFMDPEGKRVVDFRFRASIYAGLSQLFFEPQILINADTGIIQYINDLSLEYIPLNPIESVSIGGNPGWEGDPSGISSVRLFQVDDENYHFEGAIGKGSKAPGWMEMRDKEGSLAITLQDFWQQWPKSLELDAGVLKLGLLPHFEEGSFDHMGPWYKHDYLFKGESYRLREGQTRRWQIWVDLSGNGEILAKSANHHIIAVADPEQAIQTGVWGGIAASGGDGMSEYDAWADGLFEGYCRSIREQRDYGAMNWGDWWGERQVNWGNHEYDTPLQILLQFARTGDPKYFYVGEQSARHMSEVDVVHFINDDLVAYFSQWERDSYPSRPGMVHEHSVGHVGGFHSVEKVKELYVSLNVGNSPNPYLCLDPFNLGHIWTLGMSYYYLLTGDPWVKETIELIGDNLMSLTEGKYSFSGSPHSGRVNGWSMLTLAGLYKINPSERCLTAMKYIADEALKEQDPNCGGWLYPLPWGHCNCTTNKHVGEAGFITSVRINGLSEYYWLTGDERIPDAINRGVAHLNRDTWMDEQSDWRYTSCPSSLKMRQFGVTMMTLLNNIRINGSEEDLRILRKAWDAKFERLKKIPPTRPGLGKSYSTIMYGSPQAINFFQNGIKKDK
jgi:hypothetical protein